MIDRDGTIARGRAVARQGAHVRGRNKNTVGICILGGHGSAATDKFSDNFSKEQNASLRALIADLRRQYPSIKTVSGHNQYAASLSRLSGLNLSQQSAYWLFNGASGCTFKTIQRNENMKYFKPKSLTCWTGIICLGVGAILSIHAGYDLSGLGVVLAVMNSDFLPSFTIMQGLGLVGLPGALS